MPYSTPLPLQVTIQKKPGQKPKKNMPHVYLRLLQQERRISLPWCILESGDQLQGLKFRALRKHSKMTLSKTVDNLPPECCFVAVKPILRVDTNQLNTNR